MPEPDEVEVPAADFRMVLRDEADKVPERAKEYYEDWGRTLDPVLKTVAVIAAGVATVIGFAAIFGGSGRGRKDDG